MSRPRAAGLRQEPETSLAIYAEPFRFRSEKDADKVSLLAEHLKFKMTAPWLSGETCFRNGRQ